MWGWSRPPSDLDLGGEPEVKMYDDQPLRSKKNGLSLFSLFMNLPEACWTHFITFLIIFMVLRGV